MTTELLNSLGVSLQFNENGLSRKDILETQSGIKLSRKSFVLGNKNVQINGKSIISQDVVIRGDLSKIKIER